MVLKRIAKSSETEAITSLIEQGDFGAALSRAASELSEDIGQFCMALLGDQALAEEATVRTLSDFYAAMPAMTNPRPRPWLFETAYRACKQLRASAAISHQESDSSTDGSADAASENAPALIRTLLSSMKPEERETSLLRYLARLGYADIANICDLSEESVRKHVSKALLRIRSTVQDDASSMDEIESEPSSGGQE